MQTQPSINAADFWSQVKAEMASRSERQIATDFHKLAVKVVRHAIERRRWLKAADSRTAHHGLIRTFYGDYWTPEAAKLARFYRDLARKHRAAARAEEAASKREAA